MTKLPYSLNIYIVNITALVYSVFVSFQVIAQEPDSVDTAKSLWELNQNSSFPDSLMNNGPLDPLTIRLIREPELREQFFPENYELESIVNLAAQDQFHLSAWYLVHLYEKEQVKVLQLIKILSHYHSTKNLFIEAFHLFAYADPNLLSYKNGKPELLDPGKLENIIERTNALNKIFNYYLEKEGKE